MAIQLRGGRSTEDPRLDRIPQFDQKSLNYPIRTLLNTIELKQRSYTWKAGPQLDQGQEGACVGFSWSGELGASPKMVKGIDNAFAINIYNRARQLDEWEGEDYSGSSVLGGAKAVAEAGYMTEYRWALGLQDVVDTIGHFGPVVLGINWYEGMMTPDDKAYIHVTGDAVGGHAILARGVNFKQRRVTLRNSWGSDWGANGGCHISFDDLDRLLHEEGEACVPVKRLVK